jgi:hypothetical protein
VGIFLNCLGKIPTHFRNNPLCSIHKSITFAIENKTNVQPYNNDDYEKDDVNNGNADDDSHLCQRNDIP